MPISTRRPNQADIAAELGVSVSTVSRALANESGISEAVRQDVHRVAQSLGYRSKHVLPTTGLNRRAVALMPLGSATTGMSSFYFDIVSGIRSQAAASGLDVDVRLVNEKSVTLDLVQRQVAQSGATSLLLAGIDPWDELVAWCRDNDIHAVLVNGCDPQMRMSAVSPANFHGGYMATRQLLDAGHRRILHYSHPIRPTIRERRRGFEEAIADCPDATGIVVNTTTHSTQELLKELLAEHYDVTALFVWNDIVAVEMIEGLYADGANLPLNFSLVGFDDLPLAGMTTPRLSTIKVDREAIGRAAVRLLHQQLDGEAAVQQVEIGLSFVPGETVHALS